MTMLDLSQFQAAGPRDLLPRPPHRAADLRRTRRQQLAPEGLRGARRLPGAAQDPRQGDGGAGDDARPGDRRGQGSAPARPRRRGLPDRPEVELHAAPVPGRRSTWSATPTKASPAPARTATSWPTTRTSSSRAWRSPPTRWASASATTTSTARSSRSTIASKRRSRRRAPPATWATTSWAASFSFQLHAFHGFGAYICGEETALLESLEGKKGQPRFKPPFPASFGLYGKPTTINNTETFAAVPWIIRNGGAGLPRDRQAQQRRHQDLLGGRRRRAAGQLRDPARHAVRQAARARRWRARAAASSRP